MPVLFLINTSHFDYCHNVCYMDVEQELHAKGFYTCKTVAFVNPSHQHFKTIEEPIPFKVYSHHIKKLVGNSRERTYK